MRIGDGRELSRRAHGGGRSEFQTEAVGCHADCRFVGAAAHYESSGHEFRGVGLTGTIGPVKYHLDMGPNGQAFATAEADSCGTDVARHACRPARSCAFLGHAVVDRKRYLVPWVNTPVG